MSLAMQLVLDPQPGKGGRAWRELIDRRPQGSLSQKTLAEWRDVTRRELGLSVDRSIIATGHQTLLWHPGILAKYLAVDAFAAVHDLATANLVVDQHVGDFGTFEIPIQRTDGALATRILQLCRPAPRKDVPMGRHEAFTPPRPPDNLSQTIPSVREGVQRIFDAVYAHREAPNAAIQMANAISDLMKWGGWVRPMTNVTASDLIHTSLARALMQEMIADPWRCARCYNDAVASVPEAGIGPLLIRDEYVELPLWRIRNDGRRMRAYDNDVEAIRGQRSAISDQRSEIQNPKSKIDLLPRALFMTALVRLGMCDLFIHGTGGASYDRAMELWLRTWLGAEVGSIAVVSADLRLPLASSQPEDDLDARQVEAEFRRAWHDPESLHGAHHPGDLKKRGLADIARLPRNSPQRKAAFLTMHDELDLLRHANEDEMQRMKQRVERAKRQAADRSIAQRRDWAFPLYPSASIDELANNVRAATGRPLTGSEQSSATSWS